MFKLSTKPLKLCYQVSKYTINDVDCIESHETSSMVGVATSSGWILILEIDEQGEADIIAKYSLTSSKMVFMKFIPNSTTFVCIDEENGFYLVKRESNNDDDIKKFFLLTQNYLDYSVVKSNGNIYVLLLYMKCGLTPIESTNSSCDFITIDEHSNYAHQLQTIQLKNLYSAMQFQYYDSNKFVLGARETRIDLLQCVCGENGKVDMNAVQTIITDHLFGAIKFTVNAASILTYGNDGQILLWDKNSMRMVKSVFAHGKCSRGVKNAVFDPLQR